VSNFRKYLFVAFVPDEIDGFTQSRHHFYNSVSKLHEVLWINPPRYFQNFKFKRNYLRSRLSGNIKVFNSLFPSDYAPHYNRGKPFFSTILKLYVICWRRLNTILINRRISSYDVDEVILHIWRPEYHYALNLVKHNTSIYHVDDNYAFSSHIEKRQLSSSELRLLQYCDFSFIHSKTLFKEQANKSKNAFLLPNGVDLSLYQKHAPKFAINTERFNKYDIILGYVGAIKRHLNLPLLYDLAKNRKDLCIVLVGPIRENHKEIHEIITKLQSLENVFFDGMVSLESVPSYLFTFNIGLMPYKRNAYTRNIYPLKMHEYFAAGLPVISTDLENISEFKESLYFAHTWREYSSLIDEISSQSDHERAKNKNNLMKIASANSWDNRVSRVIRILEQNERVQ